jgi:hypothetical protein
MKYGLCRTPTQLLVQDISELEEVLRVNLFPPDLLREPHMLLRGFRSLLFLEYEGLVGAPVISSLPPVTVLLHMFSRLPVEVKMPHERTSVTQGQFSKWMDQHTQKETLESVRHAMHSSSASDILCGACFESSVGTVSFLKDDSSNDLDFAISQWVSMVRLWAKFEYLLSWHQGFVM